MSEFEPGDEVVSRRPPPYTDFFKKRVVKYVGDKFVVYDRYLHDETAEEMQMYLVDFREIYKKVVPFFEVGKTYTCAGDIFKPVMVETDSNGAPWVFGKITSPSGKYVWRAKNATDFTVWEEVTPPS